MLNITIGVRVERAQEIDSVRGDANVLQSGEQEFLGDWWEGGGEVQKDASAVRLSE